jgi:hypothetical protein
MKRIWILSLAGAALTAGCVSFNGASLVPGKSTAAEVEQLMGRPSQRVTLPNGDSALYFSRLPYGRAVFVVTVGRDGVMKSIEQRLERANIAKIVPNLWTKKEVAELFGPPGDRGRLPRQQREWWEYRFFSDYQRRVLWVQYSDDGVVREVMDMIDPEDEKNRDGQFDRR